MYLCLSNTEVYLSIFIVCKTHDCQIETNIQWSTMCTHWNNDRLLKHLSTKLDKYVFDKRIQHLSDLVQFIFIIKYLVTFDKVSVSLHDFSVEFWIWSDIVVFWSDNVVFWSDNVVCWSDNVVLFGFRFIRKSTSYYIISLYSPDFVSYLYTHLTLYHISILTWRIEIWYKVRWV
jgi:hypothetical protein